MKGAEISRHISWAFEITYGVRREMTGFFTQADGVSDDETGRTSISQTSKRPQLIRECSKFYASEAISKWKHLNRNISRKSGM